MRRGVLFASAALSFGGAFLAGACSGSSPDAPAGPSGPDASTDAPVDRGRPPDPDPVDPVITGPALLSETGLYADFAARKVAPELFGYAPRYEFWADGAEKSRWLYLPPGTTIDTSQIDHWVFPVGTKAFKELRYEGLAVETRLLMKVREGTGNGAWWEAAYVWKADGSDAVAMPGGAVAALGTTHDVPNQTACKNCHGDVSDVLIGVSALQLSDPVTSPLAALNGARRLSQAPPAGIDFPGAGNVKDALGYLHANCGHCHNSQARRLDTQSKLRLRLLVGQSVEEAAAYTTTVGTVMRHALDGGITDVVVKGDPDRSGLWLRMNQRGYYGMPPAGTQFVDDAGVATVRRWIAEWP